jgi:hypothetical protein
MKLYTVVTRLKSKPSTTNECADDLVDIIERHGARNLKHNPVKEI